MEDIKLVEKHTVVPVKPSQRRRLFLSNIDLTLVAYVESVTFFEPVPVHVTLSDVCRSLCDSLSRLLVHYDFMAGRLEPAEEGRLEIDCNDAGVVVAAATTECELSQLGELRAPKPAYRELVKFLQGKAGEKLTEKPLFLLQLTQFKCGGLALASRANHCTLDGMAAQELWANLASLTRGEDLIIRPNPDRSLFKARASPAIAHPHLEYSKLVDSDASFSTRGTCSQPPKQPAPHVPHLIYISTDRIARLKSDAHRKGRQPNCTAFHVVAARIWKARSIALGLPDNRVTTLLFPVDVRRHVLPHAPHGFAGNALVPGFARASVHELKTEGPAFLVGKVQEGLDRLKDEYIRSGIDWLEVNKGVPCRVDSFSVVAWWKLRLEEEEFGWARVSCVAPVDLKPGLVMLMSGDKEKGGINICIELPPEQMKEFYKLMMED